MEKQGKHNPKDQWTDRERDSTTLLWGILLAFFLIVILLFVSDWFFMGKRKEPYLSPMLIGILIGTTANWVTSAVKDFFEKRKINPEQNGDEATAKEGKNT